MHGWGIAQRIQQMSRSALDVGQGSVYPALLRLEHRGLVTNEWGITENHRRARYYRAAARLAIRSRGASPVVPRPTRAG